MNNKKILLMTVTCGEGHNSAAKAFSAYFEKQGIETKIVEAFESKPSTKKMYGQIPVLMSKYIPHIYQFFWRLTRKFKYKKLDNNPQIKEIKSVVPYFEKLIKEYKPTDIMCMQVVDGAILAYMKEHDLIDKSIRTYTVMLDYVLCPFWNTNLTLDYVFSTHEKCNEDLKKVGFRDEQIKCFGFPVNEKFNTKYDKLEIRKKYNLQDKFTFFSISGGNGVGNTLKLLKNILKTKGDYQVITVCGKNEKSKKEIDDFLEKNHIKNVINYGFVGNINELMCASDIAFSRGGGLSITECLYSNLPIIFRNHLINNEVENRDIFVNNGCALKLDRKNTIKSVCQKVLDDKTIVSNIKNNMSKFVKLNAISSIADFVINK